MRIMRLVVMFDLPTKTKADKDNYIKFKRFLDDDGYQREQNSVYSRNLLSRASHLKLMRNSFANISRRRDMSSPWNSRKSNMSTEKSSSTRLLLTTVTIRIQERSSS